MGKKIYTIIAGVNGVGKSSFTGMLKERLELGSIIDVDQIISDLGKGKIEGAKQASKLIEDCIQQGVSFTQETTLSGRRAEAKVRQAKEFGYFIRLFYIGLNSAEDSIIRIQNRVMKGGHYIPTEDVLRRFDYRWESLERILPYCDEAEFYDNDNGFGKVASYKDKVFQIDGHMVPQWLSELTTFLQGETNIPVQQSRLENQIQNAKQRTNTSQNSMSVKEHER